MFLVTLKQTVFFLLIQSLLLFLHATVVRVLSFSLAQYQLQAIIVTATPESHTIYA
jgi:hypothetical protein